MSSGPVSMDTSSEVSTAAAPTSHFGDNKGIRFHVKTGGRTWSCTLMDRAVHDRAKAARQNSSDSVGSSASSTSEKSA